MSSTTRSLANCTSQWLSTVHTTTNGRLTSSTPPISPAIQPSSLTYHLPNSPSPRFILRLQSQALSFRLPTCIESTMNPLRASMPPNKYVYPDPIPEFAESETLKFKTELWHKLLKDKETFGDDLDHVVEVCTEINQFNLQARYLVNSCTRSMEDREHYWWNHSQIC
ncbi:protein PLASTID REDOX INSENSITIVE 2, chloroplastic isoform X2 [Ziziphus jujuba]|uniref:Protein PLASTID REDOX INSENSITIVE 2, chloroplastic isoform X2 n=1 Tax=Ziziphus jujuba TaxID=326968 RepID=A0A6P3ZSN5_ZIZJJ|nr:protein PLASTID REDOX INSENSITIVE 2, chloroplastic isoform X2 [Ziziphus jujuba]